MSPLLQSPATTLIVVGLYHLNHPRWEERTGNMNLDQGLSLQALLEGRGEQVQRLHHQTVTQGRYTGKGDLSGRHRSTSRSSATPPMRTKSKRRRRKYSGRSQTSSDESSRSRSWSPSLRRKEAVHSASGSPVSPQRHKEWHCDSTGPSRRRATSSSGYSELRLKKHSHMK